MDDAFLFRHLDGTTFEPTAAAVGPWDRRIVHGAAIAALLANRLTPTEGTLARLTVEILAPVPWAELQVERSEPRGGARVQRQEATLASDGRLVATASAVVVRETALELPARALEHESPFEPSAAPALDTPNRAAEAVVGWPSFDSRSAVVERLRVTDDRRIHQWIALTVPVIEGSSLSGVEIAVVAADYAQSAVFRHLPLTEWSFRNAELTVHLARAPVGRWVGLRSESVVQPVGAGFNAGDLFDADGRVGRSAAVIVVEPRHAT